MREYVFSARVFEGRHFPREVPSVLLSATFAGETLFKSAVKGGARTTWSTPVELAWQINSETLRNVTNSGTTNCKLTCSDVGSGASLGWLVLDLRTAKLNGARKDSHKGEWFTLSGGKAEADGGQLKVFFSFREKGVGVTPMLGEQEEGIINRAVSRGVGSAQGTPTSRQGTPEASLPADNMTPEGRQPGSPGPSTPAMELAETSAAHHLPASELVRKFKLSIDIRSMKANKSLPVNLASVFVQAFLPADMKAIVNKDVRVFPVPLKTFPATDIARGSEVALPGGYAEAEFITDVMTLASTLADEPHIMLEVWHKERMRKDMMLGMASIPLATLLHEPWVDRYAAVYAMLCYPGEGERKTQVASVRMVLSLEELGAVVQQALPCATPQRGATLKSPRTAAQPGARAEPGDNEDREVVRPPMQELVMAEPVESWRPSGASETPVGAGPSAREVQAAYDLEVWKAEEEKSWRAQLREREAERLSILEAEWRNRESLRDAEFVARKEAYSKLESKAREVLKEMAAREGKLVAAEEAVASRRGELERAAAARVSEAEAAVRRLQVECEHQLDLERHRNEELARAKLAAEDKLRAAENRADSIELAFQEYRDSQRNSTESTLQSKLFELQEALRGSETREREASQAKERYKAQVVKLARDLAALQKVRQEEQAQLLSHRLRHLDDAATGLMAGEQVLAARAQATELQGLRCQLEELRRNASQAHPAPDLHPHPHPWRPEGSGFPEKQLGSPTDSKENRQPGTGSIVSAPIAAEAKRLQGEKSSLLASGLYGERDPLIVEIDKQLAALQGH